MSFEEFKKINVKFHSDNDPITNKEIDLNFDKTIFEETDLPLF